MEQIRYPFAREDGRSFWLTADCYTADGQYRESTIDLASYLGNDDGRLQWGTTGFAQRLRGWTLDFPILTVSLLRSALETVESRVDLLERITVRDGILVCDANAVAKRATYRSEHPVGLPITPIRFLWTRNMCSLVKFEGSLGPSAPEKEFEFDEDIKLWRLLAAIPTRANTHMQVPASTRSCEVWSKECTVFLKLEGDANNTLWRGTQACYFRQRRWFDLADTSTWYKFPAGAGPGPSNLALEPAKHVFTLGMRPTNPMLSDVRTRYFQRYSHDAKFSLASTGPPKKDDLVAIVDLVDDDDGSHVYLKVVTWERALKMEAADHQGEKVSRIPELPNVSNVPVPAGNFVPISIPKLDSSKFVPIPVIPAPPPPENQPAVARFFPPGWKPSSGIPTPAIPTVPVISAIPPIPIPRINPRP